MRGGQVDQGVARGRGGDAGESSDRHGEVEGGVESEETFLLECLLQTGEGTIRRRGQSCRRGEREGSGVVWCLLHRLLLHCLLKCLMD